MGSLCALGEREGAPTTSGGGGVGGGGERAGRGRVGLCEARKKHCLLHFFGPWGALEGMTWEGAWRAGRGGGGGARGGGRIPQPRPSIPLPCSNPGFVEVAASLRARQKVSFFHDRNTHTHTHTQHDQGSLHMHTHTHTLDGHRRVGQEEERGRPRPRTHALHPQQHFTHSRPPPAFTRVTCASRTSTTAPAREAALASTASTSAAAWAARRSAVSPEAEADWNGEGGERERGRRGRESQDGVRLGGGGGGVMRSKGVRGSAGREGRAHARDAPWPASGRRHGARSTHTSTHPPPVPRSAVAALTLTHTLPPSLHLLSTSLSSPPPHLRQGALVRLLPDGFERRDLAVRLGAGLLEAVGFGCV